MYTWHCLRCGRCCTQIINNITFGKCGAYILPNEIHLFPQEVIKPLYGIGIKGKSRPRPAVIYAYQMISEPCPHYDTVNKACLIYDKRPNTCRAFPIEGAVTQTILHRECTAIQQQIPLKKDLTRKDIKGFEECFKASEIIGTYLMFTHLFNIFHVDTSCVWFYEYERSKWKQITLKDAYKTLRQLRQKVEEAYK